MNDFFIKIWIVFFKLVFEFGITELIIMMYFESFCNGYVFDGFHIVIMGIVALEKTIFHVLIQKVIIKRAPYEGFNVGIFDFYQLSHYCFMDLKHFLLLLPTLPISQHFFVVV